MLKCYSNRWWVYCLMLWYGTIMQSEKEEFNLRVPWITTTTKHKIVDEVPLWSYICAFIMSEQ